MEHEPLTSVLEAVATISQRKRKAKIVPDHSLTMELHRELPQITLQTLRQTLNQLVRQNKLTWGETLNDRFFKLK